MKNSEEEVYFLCMFGKSKLSGIPMGTQTRIKRKAMEEYRSITGNIAIDDYSCFDLSKKKYEEIMHIINRFDPNFDRD